MVKDALIDATLGRHRWLMVKATYPIDPPILWGSVFVGAVLTIFSATPFIIYTLMGMMALDIIVGITAAAIAGQINHQEAFQGALRKSVILMVVTATKLLQLQIALLIEGQVTPYFQHIPRNIPLTEFVGSFFLLYEFVSILENASRAGVRLPPILLHVLDIEGKHDATDATNILRSKFDEGPSGAIIRPDGHHHPHGIDNKR